MSCLILPKWHKRKHQPSCAGSSTKLPVRVGAFGQNSSLELVFAIPLCKLDAADRYRRCLESLEYR
jgi:hypothetical protein